MYVYEIGYHSYEESSHKHWKHEQRFSRAELTDIVAECIAESIKESKAHPQDDWFTTLDVDDNIDALITSGPFEGGLRQRGFIDLEYAEVMSFFGWVSPGERRQAFKGHAVDEDNILHEKIRGLVN